MLPARASTAGRSARFLPGMELSGAEWVKYVLGVVLPLGMWWGLMRHLAGGSPCASMQPF